MNRVLSAFLENVPISKKRIDDFLVDACSYSYQLNVLLPTLLHGRDAPKMDDALRGRLNTLRGLRNDVAHKGAAKVELDRQKAAELICAAIFGFFYVKIAEEYLPFGTAQAI